MERVTGVGGVFFRARDPKALAAWYEEHLGVPVQGDEGYAIFPESRNTVWSPSPRTPTTGRPRSRGWSTSPSHDLDAMLAQLRAAGVEVDEKIEVLDEHRPLRLGGRPGGQRFELWEPTLSGARGARQPSPYTSAGWSSKR